MAGLVCGSVAVVVLLLAAIALCWRKRKLPEILPFYGKSVSQAFEKSGKNFLWGLLSKPSGEATAITLLPVPSLSPPKFSEISPEMVDGVLRFTFNQIQSITNDFQYERLIGRGGFGQVYLGQLPNKDILAVKVLVNFNSPGRE